MTRFLKIPRSSPGPARVELRSVINLIVLGVGYLLLSRAGLLFVYQPLGISLIWPVSGLGLAVLLGSARERWKAILITIFISNFLANLLGGNAVQVSLGFAFANSVESLLIAVLLVRFTGPSFRFQGLADVLLFFALGMGGGAIAALLGAGVAALSFGAKFWNAWSVWWVSDGLGMALFTPLILAWMPGRQVEGEEPDLSPGKIMEALVLTGLLVLGCWLLFFREYTVALQSVYRAYLLFPLLTWCGLRFKHRFVTVLLVFTGLSALLGTLYGLGQFANPAQDPQLRLVGVQVYLGVLVYTTLIPSTIVKEFKQLAARLSRSEAEYRTLFQDTAVGIFHAVPGGGFQLVNPALARMLAYESPQELIEAIPDIQRQLFVDTLKIRDVVDQVLKEDQWVHDISDYRRKDGSQMTGRLSMRRVLRADGSLSHLEGFVEDVTERMRAEDELSASVQKFKSIVYSSPTAMHLYQLEPSGKLVLIDTNPMADRMLGIPRHKIIDQAIETVFPGFVENGFDEKCRLVANGSIELLTETLRYQDGRLDGIYEVHVFQTNPGFIVLDFVDVSERMLTEQIAQARLMLLELSFSHSLLELLKATLDKAEDLTGSRIGFFHFMEADQKTLVLQTWSTRTEQEYCRAQGKGMHYPVGEAGVWVDCVHANQPVIHNNYAELPHRKGLPEGHAELTRELVVPVKRGDKIVAILGVGNKAVNYSHRDQTVVMLLADLAWDIAERMRIESALKKSETLLNETQSMAMVGGWEYDRSSRKMVWTREVYHIFGVPESYEIGDLMEVLRFVDEQDRPHLREAFRNAVKLGQSYDIDVRFVSAQGKNMWLRTAGTAVMENGRVVKVTGTVMNISELKFAQASLARNEEQLRLAMDASSDGIWDWRCQENISTFNPAYAHMLGYEPGEIPRDTTEWVELVHPEDYDLIKQTNQAMLNGSTQTCEIEIRMKTRNGRYKWILSRGKAVKWDGSGKPLRIIGTHVDITERKQAEEALKRANRKLESQVVANEALQALLVEQATHDALTGLYNRRYMDDALRRELSRAEREELPVCVLMLDVDHFKGFNDKHGHEAGDQVLVSLGSLLHHSVRESDIACRYGGEEFVVILPGASLEDGLHRAERLRADFSVIGRQPATISVGVAVYPQHGQSPDELLRAADNAMYAAKEGGRNCVRAAL